MKRDPDHEHRPPEPWGTKRQLADHLSVTPRWGSSPNSRSAFRTCPLAAWTAIACQRSRLGCASATASPQQHLSQV